MSPAPPPAPSRPPTWSSSFRTAPTRWTNPCLDAVDVVGNPEHPAIVHFDADTQAEIKENLETADRADRGHAT